MGLYPDLPGYRFAYDQDGTLVQHRGNATAFAPANPTGVGYMNNESSNDGLSSLVGFDWGTTYDISLFFPEARNLTGIVWRHLHTGTNPTLWISTDTTDGVNGTWTNTLALTSQPQASPNFRNAIQALTANGVKGIQIRLNNNNGNGTVAVFEMLALYGTRVAQGLEFWDPATDVIASVNTFDFAEIQQGQVASKTFRIKNRHATSTAVAPQVSRATPSGSMAVQFSTNGTTWSDSLALADIAPGGTSPVITMRRTVPANETVRVQACRVQAAATSWS